jgi:hypothetical protein
LDAKTDSEAIRRTLQKAIEDSELDHREIEAAVMEMVRRGRFRPVYR